MSSSLPLIGTAGWSYPHWDGIVYPKPQTRGLHALEYVARFIDLIEINSSFYRTHRPETYARWAAATPAGFRFAVKAPKAATHECLLENTARIMDTFLEGILELGAKLGPVLVQFPRQGWRIQSGS